MTLVEAVKTGLPFRRKNEIGWKNHHLNIYLYSPADILADDWEVEEERIEITKLALRNALDCVRLEHNQNYTSILETLWHRLTEDKKHDK